MSLQNCTTLYRKIKSHIVLGVDYYAQLTFFRWQFKELIKFQKMKVHFTGDKSVSFSMQIKDNITISQK